MTHTHYRSTNRKKHPAETAAAAARDRAAARGTATVACDHVGSGEAAVPKTAAATPPPIDSIVQEEKPAEPKRCGRPRKADNEAPSSKSNAWYYRNRDKASDDAKRRYALVKDDPAYIERRKQRVNRRYRENAGGLRDKIHARNKTAAHRYSLYRTQAKRAGRAFTITREQFDALFFAAACSYCGTARVDPQTLGIDRFDNNVGYEPENCRACCAACNYMKLAMTMDDFVEKCQAIRDISTNGPPTLTAAQVDALPIMRWDKYKCNTFGKYKYDAAERGIEFALTRDDFMRLIDEPCRYCWTARGGIDRVDNTVGYFLPNCVPCCRTCNSMKNASTKEDFIAHCTRIATFYPTTQ
ncbi:endonuclease [Pandoravirus quercus]|uniref:Uncharacterized protein n=1 Tax=Pandoravirus quercus TaxID=2107709 RepID=A0A2U7UAL5_9VIRU|nr:endonuclease [Pandoravirus quercus]AVK75425.1 hypothetical protein pqer_cds_1003 [Pandoravirus quercus]